MKLIRVVLLLCFFLSVHVFVVVCVCDVHLVVLISLDLFGLCSELDRVVIMMAMSIAW